MTEKADIIGYSFKIYKIENGWIVEFFSNKGPCANDHTSFFPTFKAALEEVADWKGIVDAVN